LVAIAPTKNTDKGWLAYELARRKASFEGIATQNAQLNINLEKLRPYLLPYPPVPEQCAIAEALSDVDELLGGLDRLIAKKRDLKRAAMQQLLTGGTRLPGFHEEWKIKRLGDLFEITSSKRVFQSEWKSGGIPFYRARELAVLGEAGRVQNELFITRELYKKHRRAYGVPSIGDMLVTGVGTLGKVYVVSDDREFYFKDGNIIWFKIEEKMSAAFLRQLYLTEAVQMQVAEGGAGTTVGTYTISAAKKTTIPFPTLAEQTAIAEVLTEWTRSWRRWSCGGRRPACSNRL
jgi:type I restriction enzyme S subunit